MWAFIVGADPLSPRTFIITRHLPACLVGERPTKCAPFTLHSANIDNQRLSLPTHHSYSNRPPATTQFDPVLIQTIQAEVAESLVALSVSCVPYYKPTHLLRACHIKAVAPSEFRNLKVNYIKETFPRPAACHISRRRETHNESLTHTASAPPRHGR